MQLTLGEMLYRFRIERDVEAKQVCHGLCSASTLSKMENGQRVPDTLMFEYFVERMGISSELFSIMITEEEHEYHDWKSKVYETIEKEEWDELNILLQSKIIKKTYCNKKLETQFFAYASAIYNGKKRNYAKAAELLKYAAEQTIPEPSGIIEANVLLGSLELSILMLYLYYGVKGNVLTVQQGEHLFELLENYLYSDALDENEQAMCYPKLVCIAVHVLEQITECKQEEYLKKAICICQKNKTFHDLIEVLRLYILLLEKDNRQNLAFYKKQYEVFLDLLKSEGIPSDFKPEGVQMSKPNYYIVQEYLASKRREKGFTQEMLSDGICEPETYSRIEGGKRTPSKKNMQRLSERLGISWNYYRGELNTCDPKAFKLRKMHRIAEIQGNREESLKVLQKLEKLLDMTYIENRQYIGANECMLKYRLGLLDVESAYNELTELLALTQGAESDESRLKYYSQTELEIIGNIAILRKTQDKSEEGIHIIVAVIKQMLNSKLDLEEQWNGFDYLLRILSELYFEIGSYDIANEIDNYVKRIKIKQREADTLTLVLDKIADDLEHMGQQYSEEYKKLYRYTYYVSDFFGIGIAEAARLYYERCFDNNIKWY